MRWPLAFSGSILRRRVQAENANFVGGFAYFAQGLFESCNNVCFHVDKELIFPRAAVNWAALDFQKVHAVAGKRLER